MLDLEKELKRMSEAYNIPEKEVVKWFRGAVRQMFSNSVFYRKYVGDVSTLVKNENTRSMKRYPMVKRFTCAICGEQFGSGGIELLPEKTAYTSFDGSLQEHSWLSLAEMYYSCAKMRDGSFPTLVSLFEDYGVEYNLC